MQVPSSILSSTASSSDACDFSKIHILIENWTGDLRSAKYRSLRSAICEPCSKTTKLDAPPSSYWTPQIINLMLIPNRDHDMIDG
jgi:hypothetical protein